MIECPAIADDYKKVYNDYDDANSNYYGSHYDAGFKNCEEGLDALSIGIDDIGLLVIFKFNKF